MPTSIEVREEIRSKGRLVLDVVNDDTLTHSEKSLRVEQIETDIQALVKSAGELERIEAARAKYAGGATEKTPSSDEPPAGSWGEQFVRSIAGQSLNTKSRFTTGPVQLKATMTSTASPVVQEQVQPGIVPILFERLTVANLLLQGTTNSSAVRYLKETTATNAAAAVAEEGLKPESTLVLAEVDEPVRKIATTLKVTDEMFEDVAGLQSYVDGRLRLFVAQEEEDQLLNGSGVSPNLTGLRNRTGMQTDVAYTTGQRADSIYTMITNIRTGSFLEPDGIVVNPADWSDIRLSKDSNGNYLGSGPFADDQTPRLWGLPVVITSAITAGTALVGAFRSGAQVFRRNGITVEATNSNENDFLYNRVAIRAEERLALAVYRPAAFGEVTGL